MVEVRSIAVEVVAVFGSVVEGRGECVFGLQWTVETVVVVWSERDCGVERMGGVGG